LGINSGRERTGDVASGRGGRRGDPGLGELESESEDHTEGDDLEPVEKRVTFLHRRFYVLWLFMKKEFFNFQFSIFKQFPMMRF
jgi:hypothetical protein